MTTNARRKATAVERMTDAGKDEYETTFELPKVSKAEIAAAAATVAKLLGEPPPDAT